VLDRGRIAGDFPTSRYTLDEVTEIMRDVAATGKFVEPERHRAADAASRPDQAAGAP
jgi:hypothetical protein